MQDVAEVGVIRVENGNKNTIGEVRTTGIKGTREECQHDVKGDMTSCQRTKATCSVEEYHRSG